MEKYKRIFRKMNSQKRDGIIGRLCLLYGLSTLQIVDNLNPVD